MHLHKLLKTFTILILYAICCVGCGDYVKRLKKPEYGPSQRNPHTSIEDHICTDSAGCDSGLSCVANPRSTTEGTCRASTPCTQDLDCASEPVKTHCGEVQGIGMKLMECKKPVIKVTEGNSCTDADACDSGLVCVANPGSTTEGTCKIFTPCTTMADCASEPTDNACIYVQGIGAKIQLCGEQENNIGASVAQNDTCTMVNDCVQGTLCIADLGKTQTGTCQPADICKNDSDCTSNEKPACIEVQGANSLIQVCGQFYCDENDLCEDDKVCILAKDDFSKGHCVQECMDDTDCDDRTDGKTACIPPENLMIEAGNDSSMTSPKICQKPKTVEAKLGDIGGCDVAACAPNIICTPHIPSGPFGKGTCKLPCETEGYGKACNDKRNAYCTEILNRNTNKSQLGCTESQYGFNRDSMKIIPNEELDTQACDATTHLCPRGWNNDYLCVKENSGDTTGKCLELAGGNRTCPVGKGVVTVQKDLIITQGEKIADDELKFCR